MSGVGIDDLVRAKEAANRRLDEIREQIERLETEAVEVTDELTSYEAALQTLRRLSAKLKAAAEEDGLEDSPAHGQIRRWIENALNTVGRNGITAAAIRDYVNKKHSTDISSNTVSVTLNRIKKSNGAHWDGQEWHPADAPSGSSGISWELTPEQRQISADLDDDIPF